MADVMATGYGVDRDLPCGRCYDNVIVGMTTVAEVKPLCD